MGLDDMTKQLFDRAGDLKNRLVQEFDEVTDRDMEEAGDDPDQIVDKISEKTGQSREQVEQRVRDVAQRS